MRFSVALWIRQWAQPSLFYRRRSAFYRWRAHRSYSRGKRDGDRFALLAHADFVRALDAESKRGAKP